MVTAIVSAPAFAGIQYSGSAVATSLELRSFLETTIATECGPVVGAAELALVSLPEHLTVRLGSGETISYFMFTVRAQFPPRSDEVPPEIEEIRIQAVEEFDPSGEAERLKMSSLLTTSRTNSSIGICGEDRH